MSKKPPRKKLKQSTILETFRRQSGEKTDSDIQIENHKGKFNSDEVVVLDEEDTEMEKINNTVKKEPHATNKDIREKALQAAESRRKANSPVVTPTKSENSVDDVKAGCSKDDTAAEPDSQGSLSACSPTQEMMDNSEPLFDSDFEMEEFCEPEVKKLVMPTKSGHQGKVTFRGLAKAKLQTTPSCSQKLPQLKATAHHHVLVRTPLKLGQVPDPFPSKYQDKWNNDYVKMPCSNENLYPVEAAKGGRKELKNRWELIQVALRDNISNSYDLEEAILTYNTRYAQKWDFSGLHTYFTEVLELEEQEAFFKKTLPKMVDLAVQLPLICTQGIPLLKKQQEKKITLSQKQCASLVANAFFCTFPRRNARQKQSEYFTFPDINFNGLFSGSKNGVHPRKVAKLHCILNYFRRVTNKIPTGNVTFHRQVIKKEDFPRWEKSSAALTQLHVSSTGNIEDDGQGMLQVDFANKYLGGGVLRWGCVQEEIRFLICPEMMISKLITEELDHNECLIMTGCERFSNYVGYADTFQWAGNHQDTTRRDSWGRLHCDVVAIDALVIRSYPDQFLSHMVRRELNKAYCGFHSPDTMPSKLSAVATGNWGCGAFGGDLRIKALIQMMAATVARRDLCYFTFDDADLRDDLHKMHEFLNDKKLVISDIWALIEQYQKNVCSKLVGRKRPSKTLFDYVYSVYGDYDGDTDEETQPSSTELDSMQSKEKGALADWASKPSPDYAAETP